MAGSVRFVKNDVASLGVSVSSSQKVANEPASFHFSARTRLLYSSREHDWPGPDWQDTTADLKSEWGPKREQKLTYGRLRRSARCVDRDHPSSSGVRTLLCLA